VGSAPPRRQLGKVRRPAARPARQGPPPMLTKQVRWTRTAATLSKLRLDASECFCADRGPQGQRGPARPVRQGFPAKSPKVLDAAQVCQRARGPPALRLPGPGFCSGPPGTRGVRDLPAVWIGGLGPGIAVVAHPNFGLPYLVRPATGLQTQTGPAAPMAGQQGRLPRTRSRGRRFRRLMLANVCVD